MLLIGVIVIVRMRLKRNISNNLFLVAIFFGLNVLCFLGISHGHHVLQHTHINYSHVPAPCSRRIVSRSGQVNTLDILQTVNDQATQAPSNNGGPHVPGTGSVLQASNRITLAVPAYQRQALFPEVFVELGDAQRLPSRGRAPPTA